MKLAILLLAFVAAASAGDSLKEVLSGIVGFFPKDKMREIAANHMESNPDFKRVVTYLQGPEWAKLVADISANAAWKNFKDYLQQSGVDAEKIVRFAHNLVANAKPTGDGSKTLRNFIDEILEVIPTAKIIAHMKEQVAKCDKFKELFDKVSCEKAHKLFHDVMDLPEVQRIVKALKEMKMDVDGVIKNVEKLFGWK